MNSGISLVHMPELVLDKILEHTNFRSMLNLRKVCRSLRSFIDENPLKSSCTSISIMVVAKKILVNCDFSDKKDTIVTYLDHKNGCAVEYETRRIIVKNGGFIDVFANDLKTILHFQKAPLQRFSLSFKYGEGNVQDSEGSISMVQEKLRAILESRKTHLPVEKFVMNAFEGTHIMSILPYISSKYLKEIWILNPSFWGDRFNSLDIDEASELEQWKSAKSIFVRRGVDPTAIPYFGHTKAAYITFSDLSINDVEVIENTFLQSPTLRRLRFKYSFLKDEERLFRILGASFENPGSIEKNWYIRIANSEEILNVMYISRIQNIAFSRIELSKVPVGAVIQE